jgi:quercetin dioxygenase-like cupin family protein
MDEKTVFIEDLKGLVKSLPPDSILSRSLYEDEHQKIILFGFQPGQELSEHTASVPAVLHFLQGEADLTLGKDQQLAREGSWARIPANLPHSIKARSETLMLLTLNNSQKE